MLLLGLKKPKAPIFDEQETFMFRSICVDCGWFVLLWFFDNVDVLDVVDDAGENEDTGRVTVDFVPRIVTPVEVTGFELCFEHLFLIMLLVVLFILPVKAI